MKILLDHISKDKLVDVNMEFVTDNIYGLHFKNDIGREELLRILCGLYKQSRGNIYINGLLIDTNEIYKYNVGATTKGMDFCHNMTGYQNLKQIAGILKKADKEDIIYALETVNLESEAHKKVKYYTLDMKEKLAVAQLIMDNPDILILDDPFTDMDKGSVEKIKKYLIKKKKNKIIIIASCDKKDLDICDYVFDFLNGRF